MTTIHETRIVRGTAAEIAALTLAADEIGVATDTGVVKMGAQTFVPAAVRDTAANLAAAVLPSGQFGYETDTKVLRLGDGTTAFAALPALVDLP